jgi:hypothetical protein
VLEYNRKTNQDVTLFDRKKGESNSAELDLLDTKLSDRQIIIMTASEWRTCVSPSLLPSAGCLFLDECWKGRGEFLLSSLCKELHNNKTHTHTHTQ